MTVNFSQILGIKWAEIDEMACLAQDDQNLTSQAIFLQLAEHADRAGEMTQWYSTSSGGPMLDRSEHAHKARPWRREGRRTSGLAGWSA